MRDQEQGKLIRRFRKRNNGHFGRGYWLGGSWERCILTRGWRHGCAPVHKVTMLDPSRTCVLHGTCYTPVRFVKTTTKLSPCRQGKRSRVDCLVGGKSQVQNTQDSTSYRRKEKRNMWICVCVKKYWKVRGEIQETQGTAGIIHRGWGCPRKSSRCGGQHFHSDFLDR